MKKLIVLVIFLVCGPGMFAQAPSLNIPKGKKPNILFILIDDMGYADLGCYGNEEVKTPAIDQLAREGIRFPNIMPVLRFEVWDAAANGAFSQFVWLE